MLECLFPHWIKEAGGSFACWLLLIFKYMGDQIDLTWGRSCWPYMCPQVEERMDYDKAIVEYQVNADGVLTSAVLPAVRRLYSVSSMTNHSQPRHRYRLLNISSCRKVFFILFYFKYSFLILNLKITFYFKFYFIFSRWE